MSQQNGAANGIQPIRSETNLVAGHPQDARIARPKHFDRRSVAQPELLEPVDVIGAAEDSGDPRTMARGEALQRNDLGVGGFDHGLRQGKGKDGPNVPTISFV